MHVTAAAAAHGDEKDDNGGQGEGGWWGVAWGLRFGAMCQFVEDPLRWR